MYWQNSLRLINKSSTLLDKYLNYNSTTFHWHLGRLRPLGDVQNMGIDEQICILLTVFEHNKYGVLTYSDNFHS